MTSAITCDEEGMELEEATYEMDEADKKYLATAFSYHSPKGTQAERYPKLRAQARALAELIIDEVPKSRERSLALTKIEESVMWANSGIARNE